MMVKDLVFIQGIPIFNGFIVNDNPETTNVLEFGDYESNSKSGEINRITGQIILVDIETVNDDGGWTSNVLYIGNCKKTEKLF
jgi:hypothetical protein